MEKKYIIFFVISFCWILGTIGLAFNVDVPPGSSKNLEIIKLTFLSFGAYGVITATYFNIVNSVESTQNIKDKINFDKTENSINFIERWDSPSLKQTRDFTRKIIEECSKISDEDLIKRISENEDLKRSVITEFNFWEGIYLAIKYNNANEDLLKSAFKDTYCITFDVFKVWLKHMEREYPEGIKNLENLYRLWSK